VFLLRSVRWYQRIENFFCDDRYDYSLMLSKCLSFSSDIDDQQTELIMDYTQISSVDEDSFKKNERVSVEA
jgi:hypothetical protein